MAEEDLIQEQNTEKEPTIPERKDLLTLLKEWPLSRKIALGAVAVISIALFAVIIFQARTADFQLLYANLEQKDASSVTTWLKGQRIDYQLKNNGKNIWIPADKIYESRLDLAAIDLPSGGGVGFEVFDKQSFALTDFVQKVNYTRALQGELARTVTSLGPVESTRVHLALPEKRLFKNQQKLATASVIVTLVPGRSLDKEQVQGIIHLISGSVTGLAPENVTVINANGKILEGMDTEKDEQRISVDMLAFQQEVEHRLEIRAQDLLDRTMGYGRAMVRVTASLDFAKVEKTEEMFDADDPVIRSEQLQQESSGSQGTGGIPGVQSNLQGNSAGQTVTTPGSNKSSRTINYEISKSISKIINPVGAIKTLSVSVLIADKIIPPKDEKSEAAITPRSAEELKAIETMVSSALGLVSERGDIINVTSMPFMEKAEEQLIAEGLPKNLLYEYLPLLKIGLLFLGALLFYFLLVRPIIKTMKKEVTEHNKTISELERDALEAKAAAELVEEIEEEEIIPDSIITLRQQIMRNHVPTAYIIKNWIQEG
ncbi:MAG: flagellar M-ring protein FliF [Proteobacteria bacterium]|nr:flagellar M-ring protein FliF [Pseudomonadota bacterium]MBU1231236.1 flagellar M-ring protein FliF [Pseudomonadota bacterium]MBU1416960.1 flagellar M-ring protein FliF [Pseudomonadota bacterium]MBU1454671.1 flagellar M-ring protein FliF [Pseudomonadota bacterium]